METKNYFLGLDIGTDSVGYAVTDTTECYNLLKHSGEPMWGVHLFDAANLCDERRAFRTARRRLDRRQQRVNLTQELFATEIAKVDPKFYLRISESGLLRTDAAEPYCLFNDAAFTDKEYHKLYPTIHHLITELIENPAPHDIRLVYIACAWLVAHRGHFLSDVSENNLDSLLDFKAVYNNLMTYFDSISEGNATRAWDADEIKIESLGKILKAQIGKNRKYEEICKLLYEGKKPAKKPVENGFPFSQEGILKLLSGSKYSVAVLFGKEEYSEIETFSLDAKDETFDNIYRTLGDDAELIAYLKAIYDWAVLSDLLKGKQYLSSAKVEIYNRHKKDLAELKSYVKKNNPDKYNEIFRIVSANNYSAYSGNTKSIRKDDISKFKKCNSQEDFCTYIKKALSLDESVVSSGKMSQDMYDRINNFTFMPKQVTGDNRVIPYQLYYIELKKILENASHYFDFLTAKDSDGYETKEKILSVMRFRVPYFVGPLNKHNNEHAWIERKAEGKIYPWNFDEKVDLEKSEQNFIDRMTNQCSFLAGEEVLPKHSLLYEKFEVLNEINNIKINGQRISVEAKQIIFNELFAANYKVPNKKETRKKVTLKRIKSCLMMKCGLSQEDVDTISGIDVDIKSSLSARLAFNKLISSGKLTENDVEDIISRITYSEDRNRLRKWIDSKYPSLSAEDRKYIAALKFKEFGRLSRELLEGLCEINTETGEYNEQCTVIKLMWDTNNNLSELLLSDKYSFKAQIEEHNKEYYSSRNMSLSKRLDEMYVSNAVKRPIIRTLDIVSDVVKATGKAPEKIFVEMARGADEKQKNKRTVSRRDQLLELYKKVKCEDIKELTDLTNQKIRCEDIKELTNLLNQKTDNDLQSDKLFLYFVQLGKSMYSGKTIDIEKIGDNKIYDIDHIYPQSFVKDDSILNNKVLVLSTENGAKGNTYPISANIRAEMHSFWSNLKEANLITDEKYRRLVRNTAFTEEEEWGFINRQIVETRQSTKVVTQLLQEKYPDTKIVYVKAGLVSEFRHDNNLLKSREINDLHHAKDAYLNVVCGNVYAEKFTREWFNRTHGSKEYTINQKTLFNHKVEIGSKTVWNPSTSYPSIKSIYYKNNAHLTVYSFCRHGALFDQQPIKKADGLVPRKDGLNTIDYGGYNKPSNSYFILAKYSIGSKSEIIVTPVEYMYSVKLDNGTLSYESYAKKRIEGIIKKTIDSIEFPLGYRKIKINTVLSLDGFRGTITGSGSGGKCIVISPIMPLILAAKWENYIKRLESFTTKIKENNKIVYSETFDTVNKNDNEELYNMLMLKYSGSIYSKRPNPQGKTLTDGFDKFKNLDVKDQATVLLNIIKSFSRLTSGCDFTLIGAASKAASTVNFSSSLSNWKKNYKAVKIIDSSASGIWEKESDNLLSLL